MFMLLCINSCTPLEMLDIGEDYIDSTQKCFANTYVTEYQELGIYRDFENKDYNVLIDYESYDDKINSQFSVKDIAELASIAIDTYKEYDSKTYEEIYKERFKNFHVIVTDTDDEFAFLKNPKLFSEDKEAALEAVETVGAFVHNNKFCWDKTDTYFTIVIRSDNFVIPIMVHEFGHIYNYYEFGSGDANHENPNVWFGLTGFDSMNGKVLWNYEFRKQVDVIKGGPI